MKDELDGVYKASASKDDRQLAFLVLKFSGPSLLDILYRANILPSTSTAYRMAKGCKKLKSSVNLTQASCFKENVTINVDEESKWAFSFKQDETCLNPKLRFNSNDGQIVGVCYQHGHQVILNFNEYKDAELVHDMISNDTLHVPKEVLVTGLNCMTNAAPLQVISVFPSCAEDDYQAQ